MRKAIFVLITTVATTAVVAVGTSAFAVAIAPPDVHGQVQDLPAIISGAWSPVEFDVTSTAREPIAVAGPVAAPIGQQAKEEPTTDPSDEAAGQDGGTGGSGRRGAGGRLEHGCQGDVKKDKADKEKAEKEKKDKADKEKADKEKKDKEKKDKADKEKADKEKKDKAEPRRRRRDDE